MRDTPLQPFNYISNNNNKASFFRLKKNPDDMLIYVFIKKKVLAISTSLEDIK